MTFKRSNMATSNRNKISSTLFDARVGDCFISMCLDKRHPEIVKDFSFPLCVKFHISGSRYYYSLGEKCTEDEMIRLSKAKGNREKRIGTETTFERKVRLQEVFEGMVNVVTTVNERGVLTLDRIKLALTGRSESASFLSVWEEIIREKRSSGKAGTAENYENAYRCFTSLTGFTYADGFAVDSTVISKWIESMTEKNIKSTTQGIRLRACRVVVNRCIGEGYMLPKAYMFGKTRDKIKIPAGSSRKEWFLTVKAIELIYQSLAMFLMQYLCCGCNLIDLALLRYNRYYFESDCRAFRFIRHKTEDETIDGDGMEVIVPITDPMREILDFYSPTAKMDQLVFPFLMDDVGEEDANAVRKRICQENKNIRDRLKKLMDAIGWSMNLTGTYARHSFATNLHAAKVPMEYISDAMGHSLGNRGQITIRYISPYTIEERAMFNRLLLNVGDTSKDSIEESQNTVNKTSITPSKQALFEKMDAFSEDDIKEALLMLKRKEMERFEKELYG